MPSVNDSPCRLCGCNAQLRISHVFPKFIVDWFKDTGTGYIRNAILVNKRSQDGSKERMLCGDCEQRFSSRESYFATSVFYPVLNGATNIRYDSRLMYFLVSVLWRVAEANLRKLRAKGNRFLDIMEAAAEEWRQFLLGNGKLDRFGHVHLFVFDIAGNPPPMAKGYNVYCARALDGTFFNNEQACYLYAKLARFLCIALLTPYDEGQWINTRILNGDSVLLHAPQELRDTFAGNFTVYRARTIAEIVDSQMSARQRSVVDDYFFRNADRMANSDLARAAFADYEGQQAFMASLPKVGRNQKCPCGSGEKFKDCHGKPSTTSKYS